jgi:hypothetical protein
MRRDDVDRRTPTLAELVESLLRFTNGEWISDAEFGDIHGAKFVAMTRRVRMVNGQLEEAHTIKVTDRGLLYLNAPAEEATSNDP